ncbi:MAG: hypothetical protein N4A45_05580 [Flavobacteriales bacterium]|jgi:hypothetical protein|nr:hypothetical protein [Flavobacteriales bacterium]
MLRSILFSVYLMFLIPLSAQPTHPVAPNVVFDDISGVSHNIYTYLSQNRTVVLEFYNSSHPASISSRPGMNDLNNTHGLFGNASHILISIDMDTLTNNESAFANTHNILYPVVSNVQDFDAYNWDLSEPMFVIICPDKGWMVRKGSIFDDTSYITALSGQCAPLSNRILDAKIYNFIADDQYCNKSHQAQFYIQNYSQTLPLTKAKITAKEAGIVRGVTYWNGFLSPYQVDTIFMDLDGISGYDLLEFEIDSINNIKDPYPENNTFNQILREGRDVFEKIFITLTTDYYPQEISWSIIRENGDTLVKSPKYTEENKEYKYTAFVGYGGFECYEIVVEDKTGNGILSGNTPDGYAMGDLLVTTDQGDSLLTDHQFEHKARRKFYRRYDLEVEEENIPELEYTYQSGMISLENLSSGGIITLQDVQGRTLISKKVESSFVEMNLGNFPMGVYYLNYHHAKGNSVSKLIHY